MHGSNWLSLFVTKLPLFKLNPAARRWPPDVRFVRIADSGPHTSKTKSILFYHQYLRMTGTRQNSRRNVLSIAMHPYVGT